MKSLLYPTLTGSLLLVGTLAHAQTIPLASTWQLNDPTNIWTLTAQSASGFTANVTPNTTGEAGVRPSIVQTFADIPFTNNGARVQVEFDVVFNKATEVSDTQWRFGAGCTNNNELIWVGYDLSTASGTCIRQRMDNNNGPSSPTITGNGITESNAVGSVTGSFGTFDVFLFDNAIWNSAYSSSYNLLGIGGATSVAALGSGNTAPNGNTNGLGAPNALGVVHHFRYAVERTPTSIHQSSVWSNSAGTNFVGVVGHYADTQLSVYNPNLWPGINLFGFGYTRDTMFGVGTNGSFTVSNLKVTSGFAITSVSRNSGSGDVVLKWESSPLDTDMGASYVVQYATNLISPVWTAISTNSAAANTNGFWTSFTNTATVGNAAFYRVQKVY